MKAKYNSHFRGEPPPDPANVLNLLVDLDLQADGQVKEQRVYGGQVVALRLLPQAEGPTAAAAGAGTSGSGDHHLLTL